MVIMGLVLSEGHPWREEAPGIGTVSFDGGVEDLDMAARAHLDVLLLSAAALYEVPDSVEELRRYRVARPTVRMVVSYPVDTRPRDPLLAACVSMGIYDFVMDGTPLAEALAAHATYADAARWHLPVGQLRVREQKVTAPAWEVLVQGVEPVAQPARAPGLAGKLRARAGSRWVKGSLIAACVVLGTLLAWHLGEGRFSTAYAATAATVMETKASSPASATTTPTVTAYEPTVTILLRSSIQADQLKPVQVPEGMAAGLVQNAGDFTGKTAVTTLLPGDLIYENELGDRPALNPGFASVTVKVDATTSGQLFPGDRVDIYSATGGTQASLLAADAEVLAGYDSAGDMIDPDADKVPASVELMVSQDLVPKIMATSKADQIYLSRR